MICKHTSAQLHLPTIIPVNFITIGSKKKTKKKRSWLTLATVAIFKISNPKCTSTHPEDHSYEVSLQSDQNNIFSWRKKIPIGFYSKPPTIYAPQNIPSGKFQTFMYNWIYRSIIIPNPKIVEPMVSENISEQLHERKNSNNKKQSKNNKSPNFI